jgi:drug/metabolite transporter (DMT)-like permease
MEIGLSVFVLAGIFLIADAQQFYIKGIVLALLSSMLGAVFTIYNKKFLFRYNPGVITVYELFSGWVGLSLLMLLNLPVDVLFISPDIMIPPTNLDWLYILLLSIVCTTLAFTISLNALKDLNPFILNLSVNLEPVYSIILAILIFKENNELNTGFYVGTAIILLSVFLHAMHAKYLSLKS